MRLILIHICNSRGLFYKHRIANVSETYRISAFCDFFYAEKSKVESSYTFYYEKVILSRVNHRRFAFLTF